MMSGTTDLIKFKHLKRLLALPLYQVVGVLESLWKATAKNAPDGGIGRFTNLEIAIEIEWEGDPETLVNSLVSAKWLDSPGTVIGGGECRLAVHDWEEHCPEYIKDRFRKRKARKRLRESGTCVDSDEPCPESDRTVPSIPDQTRPDQTKPNQTRNGTVPVPDLSGILKNLEPGNLANPDGKELHRIFVRLVAAKHLGGSQFDAENFFGAWIHSEAIGDRPAALFRSIVESKDWKVVTDDERSAARKRYGSGVARG